MAVRDRADQAEAALASEREKVAKLREALGAVQVATDVPEHKKNDTHFLRAGCSIAHSFASAALAETAPDASAPADVGSPSPLVFTYRNYRGEIAERRVRPIGVRFGSTEWHPEPQWLLRAFDLDKSAEREFAMADVGAPTAEADRYTVAIVEKIREGWRIDYDTGSVIDKYDIINKVKAADEILAAICAEIKARGDGPGQGIYIASKTKHASMWRRNRDCGLPIISTWIDEAGPGESSDLNDLWRRCISEARSAAALIVYREPDDVLKGAWVEVGAALSAGVPVFAVGIDKFTISHATGMTCCVSIEQACNAALALCRGRPLPPPPAAQDGEDGT